MANIQTAQSGDHDDPNTWVGGVVPVDGDTIDVMFTHVLTIVSDFTIGDGNEAVRAIEAVNTSHTIIQEGVVLTVRGEFRSYGDITFEKGSRLRMNTANDAPWDHTDGGVNATIRINGTKEEPVVLEAIGTGCVYMDPSASADGVGRFQATYAHFIGWGSDTNYVALGYQERGSDPDVNPWFMHDCTFEECYQITDHGGDSNDRSSNSTGKVEFLRCKWVNSQRPSPLPNGGNWGNLTLQSFRGADYSVRLCDFDANCRIYFNKPSGLKFEYNVIRPGCEVVRWGGSNDWVSDTMDYFRKNFFVHDNLGMELMYGDIYEDNIVIADTASGNPHFGTIHGLSGVTRISGNIFWSTNTAASSEGDGYFPYNPESGAQADNVVISENNIFLPTALGWGSDGMASTGVTWLYTVANASSKSRHNTHYVGYQGATALGETNATVAGCVAEFQGHVCVGFSGGSGLYKLGDQGQTVIDTFAAADVSNNAGYLLSAGGQSPGKSYHSGFTFSGATNVGENDVDDIDPNFIDHDRTPANWVDPTHTPSQGIIAACDRLSLGAQGYTIDDMLAYIRHGFRPRAEEYRGAGHANHGSRDLGAVQMDPKTSTTYYYDLAKTEFLSYSATGWIPPDIDTFVDNVAASGPIGPDVVQPRHYWVGDSLRIFFDGATDGADEAQIISLANSLGVPN